jgi:hypothetical protein
LKKIDFKEAKTLYENDKKEKDEQMKQKRKMMTDLGIPIDLYALLDSLNFE